MAFGRKCCGPRRVVLVLGSEERAVADPALDLEAMGDEGIKAYWESLFDPLHLRWKPGGEADATWWTIRPLTARQKDQGAALTVDRQRARYYLQCALLRVENYRITNDAGEIIATPQPDRRTPEGEASDKWFDELNLLGNELIGLMLMIAQISEARAPLSRPSGAPSGPPASSEGTTSITG
jgi:hypothetical protein